MTDFFILWREWSESGHLPALAPLPIIIRETVIPNEVRDLQGIPKRNPAKKNLLLSS